MLNLYIVRLYVRGELRSLQPVIVSERNKRAAVKRAKVFIATHYPSGKFTEDGTVHICTTDDDVLDWV